MKYNPIIHHRRSIRLQEYDYSQNGAYFITVCTQNKECLFGKIIGHDMKLNDAGEMIRIQWNELQNRFQYIQLDEYIVMPNHFHGIVIIVGAPLVGAQNCGYSQPLVDAKNILTTQARAGTRPAPTIGDIIGAFKSITTHEYIDGVKNNNWKPFNEKLWQRNYYEHIIRDKMSLGEVREYITNNPYNWNQDKLFLNT